MRLTSAYIVLISLFIASCDEEKDADPGEANVFAKFYGTINSDEAYDIIPSSDGGYILLGTNETELAEEAITKIHAIKIDTKGNVIWDKLYPDFDNDLTINEERINYAGRSMVNTGTGYIIVGDSIYDEDSSDLLLISINEEGVISGSNTITHGEGNLRGYAIEKTENGNYVVLASIEESPLPENMFLIEVDNTLQPQWQQEYGIADNGSISKSIYVAGDKISWAGTAIRNGSEQDLRIISTPPNSKNTYFDETVGLNNGRNEIGMDIEKVPGGYIITGTTDNTLNGDNDIYLIAITENGQLLWSKNFGGPGDDFGNALVYTADNTIVVLGSTESFGNGERDIILIKTDLIGNTIWSTEASELRTFGGVNDDFGADIIETIDGGLLILATEDFGDIGTMTLLKTTKDGTL